MANLTFDILARDRASATFDKLGRKTQQTSKHFAALKTIAVSAGLAIGAALVKVGRDSVKEFTAAQDAQTRLQDAFTRFPRLADSSVESINSIALALQKKTKADDESVKSGAAVLAQFVSSGKQLEQLTLLVVDFAQKTGRDVPTAAKTVGKAFLGNTRALKELGINYKMTGDKALDVANITDLLREKVGGFAEKEGKTAAGQAAILSNQFAELEETIGSKLVPVLLKLAKVLLATVDFVQRNKDVVLPLAAAIGAVVIATKLWTAAQVTLNAALLANPAGAVIVAITALAAVLVIGRQKSEKFRESVDGNFKAIGLAALSMAKVIITAFRAWLNVTLNVFNVFVQGAAKAFGWLPDVGDDIQDAAKDFSRFKDSVIHSLDAASDSVDRLQRKLHGLRTRTVHVNVVISATGPVAALSPQGRALLEGRQHGGPVTPGRSYVVGERGPEILTMGSSRGMVSPSGGGISIYGPINITAQNPREFIAKLRDYVRVNGRGDVQRALGVT